MQALNSQIENIVAEIKLFAPWIDEPALLDGVMDKNGWLETIPWQILLKEFSQIKVASPQQMNTL